VLVSGSYDDTVRLWDTETGATLQTLEGHSAFVSSVAFSPDGKVLASGSDDNTVRLWNIETGITLQTLEGCSWNVAFSPDGKVLASGSNDNTVRLWDTGTGATLQTLEAHSSFVSSVAFSPDGKVLALASDDIDARDKTVRLWDTRTGAALQTLKGHSSHVTSVAFWEKVTGVAPHSLKGTHSLQAKPVEVNVNVKGDWVTVNGQETLWLPPDYRPRRMAVYNPIIAIACSSRRIFFLHFYSM
jgi:WD40 repeat protein